MKYNVNSSDARDGIFWLIWSIPCLLIPWLLKSPEHQQAWYWPLRWRHNDCGGVSNHQPHDCLLNRIFGRISKEHQSSASLAFVREIHRGPVNFPHKWPVTRKMFPFDDVIMLCRTELISSTWTKPHQRQTSRCVPFVIFEIIQMHYDDVIMMAIASQITSLTIVYSAVYSGARQRKHTSSASLAFVWGIHRDRWIPRTKGQLRGKCFQLMTSSWLSTKLDQVIMAPDCIHVFNNTTNISFPINW